LVKGIDQFGYKGVVGQIILKSTYYYRKECEGVGWIKKAEDKVE
jgi:hypothetical protein